MTGNIYKMLLAAFCAGEISFIPADALVSVMLNY